MRLFAALFVAMAILFGGTQANAKNYATIINFQKVLSNSLENF